MIYSDSNSLKILHEFFQRKLKYRHFKKIHDIKQSPCQIIGILGNVEGVLRLFIVITELSDLCVFFLFRYSPLSYRYDIFSQGQGFKEQSELTRGPSGACGLYIFSSKSN